MAWTECHDPTMEVSQIEGRSVESKGMLNVFLDLGHRFFGSWQTNQLLVLGFDQMWGQRH